MLLRNSFPQWLYSFKPQEQSVNDLFSLPLTSIWWRHHFHHPDTCVVMSCGFVFSP